MSEGGRIVRIAARGEGVTNDGRFVAGAAPGDWLNDDGQLLAGPHHADPLCPHFGSCGGCQLQHVDDAAYRDYLADRITGALAAQGLGAPPLAPAQLSPPHSRRRVAIKAQRRGKAVTIGFSEMQAHALVDLRACLVMHSSLFALIAPLRMLLRTLLPDKRNADIAMTIADQGVDLVIAGIAAEGLAAAESLTAFAESHRLARLSIDEGYGVAARYEPEPVTITLGGIAVPLPPRSFLQATADGEAVLVAAVRAIIGNASTVADLFAGLGTFSFSTPGRVHAVEGARDAVLALQSAANRARVAATSEHRDLFRRPLTAAELARFDAVILDPPRAGAAEQVAALATSAVPRIAYVSCNPATFARDAKMLIDGGYRLERITPVGQFRWSTHVELAAAFVR